MLTWGHDLTVLSRNNNIPANATAIVAERSAGISQLKHKKFDVTIDFICANSFGVNEIFSSFEPGHYILISTVWLSKREGSPDNWPYISGLTKNYLAGKSDAENALNKQRSLGKSVTSLRLPVQSGCNDHTQRLMFYFNRMSDGQGLIRVNGGNNIIQITNSESVVRALTKAVNSELLVDIKLCDAMPGSEKLKDVLQIMSEGFEVNWFDISAEKLNILLPEYLKEEPFWGEYKLPENENNLFKITEMKPMQFGEWILPVKKIFQPNKMSSLRKKEIALIGGAESLIR